MRRLALQILQKSIREVILRTLAPGVLLALRPAVRTGVFHRILLRIAVRSGPARAAYTYCLVTPVHGIALLGIHVHKECDASTSHFGTVPRKYSTSVISELCIQSIQEPRPPLTVDSKEEAGTSTISPCPMNYGTRPSHSCERGAGFLKSTEIRKPASPISAIKRFVMVWRCVVCAKSQDQPVKNPDSASLSACLVDGDADQLQRARRVRRRSLLLSVVVQIVILAALVLIPVLSNTPRIALANVMP